MGKYISLETELFAVFNTPTWIAENIKTYPQNFVNVDNVTEYIRVSIIPSGNSVNIQSVSGLLIIDIFVSAGKGPKALLRIADVLDSFFVGKSFTTIQFWNSSFVPIGTDKDDPTLFRGSYSIPFNFFRT